METNLLGQGLELMVVGMGTVFVFLTVLVFVTGLMSRIANSIAPDQPAVAAPTPAPAATSSVDAETLEIISEAVRLHRSRQK